MTKYFDENGCMEPDALAEMAIGYSKQFLDRDITRTEYILFSYMIFMGLAGVPFNKITDTLDKLSKTLDESGDDFNVKLNSLIKELSSSVEKGG